MDTVGNGIKCKGWTCNCNVDVDVDEKCSIASGIRDAKLNIPKRNDHISFVRHIMCPGGCLCYFYLLALTFPTRNSFWLGDRVCRAIWLHNTSDQDHSDTHRDRVAHLDQCNWECRWWRRATGRLVKSLQLLFDASCSVHRKMPTPMCESVILYEDEDLHDGEVFCVRWIFTDGISVGMEWNGR